MVQLIIDFNNIPNETINNNKSYYIINHIIPINSNYKLTLNPYYQNSPYVFRDFYNHRMIIINF